MIEISIGLIAGILIILALKFFIELPFKIIQHNRRGDSLPRELDGAYHDKNNVHSRADCRRLRCARADSLGDLSQLHQVKAD